MNKRQARFVAEYLVDLNATAAARRAGYKGTDGSLRTIASRLLTKVDVQEAVAKGMKEREERTQITKDSVLKRIDQVANRCMEVERVMVFDHEEKCMVPKTAQLEDGTTVGVFEFDSTGANRALELLGKHLGLFIERHEVKGLPGGALAGDIPTEAIRARLAALKSRKKK